jgi:potassium-dependent mechanosensitive channel
MSAWAIRLSVIVFPLAQLALEPAAPQATPAPELAPAAASLSPTPIALPTMARSLETALSRVRYLQRTVEPSHDSAKIEQSLSATSVRLAEMEASLRAAGPDEVSYRQLDKMRVAWLEFHDTLSRWESTLEADATAVDAARSELKSLDETWKATLADKSADQVPAVLVEKIDHLLLSIGALQVTLRERAGALLLVQDEVSSDRARVSDALERLNKLSSEIGERLFAIESDPLWKALRAERPAGALGAQALESWREAGRDVVHLLDGDQGRFALQLTVFGALAAAGWFLVRRVKHDATADPGALEAAAFLDRPIAAAGVLALFATFWIYAPTAVPLHAAALTLLLLPYFRFLPKLVQPALRGPAYGLGAVFLLDRAHDFALPHSLFSRLLLLAIGGLGIACWGWAHRNGGRRAIGGSRAWTAGVLILVRGAIAFLVVAIVANLVGNVSLAEQLTLAAVKGAFAGGVFYIVARILESLDVLLLAFLASRGATLVIRHRALLERRARFLIRAVAAGTWVLFVLWILRIMEQSGQVIVAVLTKKWTVGNLHIGIGAIVAFAVAMTLGIFAARILRFVLDEAVLPRMTLPRGVPAAISVTVGYLVVTAGFVMAFLAAGLEMSQFTFLVGAFGVGIGFGLQNVVNNFVSGLILLYERPIQIGDVLQLATLQGRVRRIGIRSSTLATFDGAEVIVPNASLIAADVVNWTLSDRLRRVDIAVGVGYGSDPRAVLAILGRVASAHAEVLSSPEPTALFVGFGDSALLFELRFWTPEYDAYVRVGSEVRTAIFAAFKDAGIEIPFPQRDLHVKSVAPAAGEGGSFVNIDDQRRDEERRS